MNKTVLVILAILIPPLAVFFKSGVGKDLLINILLCFVFYIPGIIHAIWVTTK
ncbi:YqaE/Pmp3 family membrane protein [Sessilibacter corallicola]|uniref:YqaE/Pmp3 family membrane protein n=1 Tax=Sessilibacter corallicola TaxID=2904075 RepID=A0ABQ0AE11_9GAMM|nr:YqaE/Pmp3 family membrane protein [Sessilibacter corallicola]MCE2029970.1 YqaE/Pmp3 family membrane protein [Sessilibacter corallicola]